MAVLWLSQGATVSPRAARCQGQPHNGNGGSSRRPRLPSPSRQWKTPVRAATLSPYGAVVQTFASVVPTRIVPPGPSFHAYQLPFWATTQ